MLDDPPKPLFTGTLCTRTLNSFKFEDSDLIFDFVCTNARSFAQRTSAITTTLYELFCPPAKCGSAHSYPCRHAKKFKMAISCSWASGTDDEKKINESNWWQLCPLTHLYFCNISFYRPGFIHIIPSLGRFEKFSNQKAVHFHIFGILIQTLVSWEILLKYDLVHVFAWQYFWLLFDSAQTESPFFYLLIASL